MDENDLPAASQALRFKAPSLPAFGTVVKSSLWRKALFRLAGGHGALVSAIGANDRWTVEKLMKSGADPHRLGGWQRTPLEHAAMDDHQSALATMLALGADPNHVSSNSPNGAAVLLRLCREGHFEEGKARAANILLDAGADPKKRDGQGRSALHGAANVESGEAELAKLLISRGAELDARDAEGMTPLLLAALALNWHAMSALLAAGADVDASDGQGRTPLMASCQTQGLGRPKGIDPCIQLLLDFGADLRRRDFAGRRCVEYAQAGAARRPALAGELASIAQARMDKEAIEAGVGEASNPSGKPLRM